jgi:hypothetical protein
MTNTRDPRHVKRERRLFRRELIALLEARMQSRRCFWTWPFGHTFSGRFLTTSPAYMVSRCETCGRPYLWDSFDAYDVWKLARDSDLLTDAENEYWQERWRQLP